MKNIGIAHIKMHAFQDAITSFSLILDSMPDPHAAFNLLLCYHALGDKNRVQSEFSRLISLAPDVIDPNEHIQTETATKNITRKIHSRGNVVHFESEEEVDVFSNDLLHKLSIEKKKEREKYIMYSAKIVAPTIEGENGFDWILGLVKESPYAELASDLEITKAVSFLKTRDFSKAVETLKSFETKDVKTLSAAATNLSFLYFLEGDYDQSLKYAEIAIENDRYNARALTNKGNISFVKGDKEAAKVAYEDAVCVDAFCVEAMFNLGTT